MSLEYLTYPFNYIGMIDNIGISNEIYYLNLFVVLISLYITFWYYIYWTEIEDMIRSKAFLFKQTSTINFS